MNASLAFFGFIIIIIIIIMTLFKEEAQLDKVQSSLSNVLSFA